MRRGGERGEVENVDEGKGCADEEGVVVERWRGCNGIEINRLSVILD